MVKIQMKSLLALFCGLIFFASCNNGNEPKDLIKKKEMVNVLIDMHLADASLDYVHNNDSLLIFAKNKYNYIFKKYKIDSAAFSNSLNYYSSNSDKLATIYKSVLDSLERINKPEIAKIYRTKRFIPDSLRFNIRKVKPLKADSLTAKSKQDSIKTLKTDSLKNNSTNRYELVRKDKPEIVKDTVKIKEVKFKPLDNYLLKTDSLNTVKLLAIGIDF